MKKNNYLLLVLFLLANWRAHGQACANPVNMVIDISTGLDNYTHQKLAPLTPDDDWKVNTPADPQNVYHDVYCSTNLQSNAYGSAPPTSLTAYGGMPPAVRMISPYLDLYGNLYGSPPYESAYCPSNPRCADMFYKRDFNLWMCSALSAAINFTFVAGDNFVDVLTVNGHSYTVNYGMNITTQNNVNANVSLPIQVSHLNLQGQNSIVIRVENSSAWTGLVTYGNITIQTNAFLDFELKDKNGVKKHDFCLDEDVFLLGDILPSSLYQLDLLDGSGNILATQSFFTNPYKLNITDVFMPAAGYFSPGTYKVRLTASSACGQMVVEKEFAYLCCNAVDASFTLTKLNFGNSLEGQSNFEGLHQWAVYTAPSINTGPYTPVNLGLTGNKFTIDNPSDCFYVKHTITNACGTACTGRRFCNSGCKDKACNLTQPTNLQFDFINNIASWDPVAGASSYIVEITQNSPHCCWANDPPGGPHLVAITQTMNVSGTSCNIAFQSHSACYAIRVIAVCADESQSPPSDYVCTSGQAPSQRQSITTGLIDESATATELDLFPNPSRGTVSVSFKATRDTELNISIFDNMGRNIKTFESIKTIDGKAVVKWEAESFGKGIYLVKVMTLENRVISKKLIIE